MACFGRGLYFLTHFFCRFILSRKFFGRTFILPLIFWSQIHLVAHFFGRRSSGIGPADGAQIFFCKLAVRRLGTGLLRGGRMSADCQLQKLPIASPLSIPTNQLPIAHVGFATCRDRSAYPRGLIISGC